MIRDAATRLGRLGSILGSILLLLALSFAISWPLWSLATGNRRAFTCAVGAIAALALISLAGLSLRRRIKGRAGVSNPAGERYRPL
jgi:hypothetical protein